MKGATLVIDVYLSAPLFQESNLTGEENDSEQRRQMQYGGRDAKFLY
jgi:hypothetical protein